MLHKKGAENAQPCTHMRPLISAWTRGELSGLLRWYTKNHVAQCSCCQIAVPPTPETQSKKEDTVTPEGNL